MKLLNTSYILTLAILILSSCGGEQSTSSIDLMKYGMPIKINAPQDAEITSDDLGIMQDVTVKYGDDYNVQIFSGSTIEKSAADVALKLKNEVMNGTYFSEIVREEENGFVFKKDIDGNIDYDFRYVKLSGGSDFVFQTGLYGTYSLDQVEAMMASVKK